MKCLVIICYFYFHLTLVSSNTFLINRDRSEFNCTNVDGINDPAFIGWPYHLTCSMFASRSEYTIYHVYDADYVDYESSIICQVFANNGTLLLNQTTNYQDLIEGLGPVLDIGVINENRSYKFRTKIIILDSQKCFGFHINVVPTSFEPITCEEFVKGLESLDQSMIGQPKTLYCKLGHDDYPKVFATDVTTKWFRNCSSRPENTTIRSNGELFFPQFEYEQAGIYACTVTYNGMTRFISGYSVCVLEPPTISPHSLQCESKVFAKIEENVSLSCQLRLGVGEFSDHSFKAFWSKMSSDVEGSCQRDSLKTSAARLSCSYEYEKKCFLYVADESERYRKEEVIPIVLEIQRLSASDFGTYTISALTNNKGSELITENIDLCQDHVQKYLQAATIATIATTTVVSFFVVLVFLILLLLQKQVQARVYFKRHFKSCELDDKKYGAYISYHYTNELDKFALDYTSYCVRYTCGKLEGLGYKIYDEHKDSNNGLRVDNLLESIKKCHRVVIILTSQYINDDWSMGNLQQVFQAMIDSRTKIIFIMVPGIKQYLKQHAVKDDACNLIQAAIKLNHSIQWSNGKSFDKNFFDLQLEDAMPKLESQKSRRCSTSSSSQSAGTRMQITAYQRCISTNTQVSELGISNS
ncbi:uncharacterized protein LOC143457054 [Clavelina lepadiformis]|uniref:uncharacterized protein LOC143457054 n=1 Tax=Clavelina lepadiformis TaxID=159417 RepID=UPI004043930E